MRRLAFGLCALLPAALVLLSTSCTRQDVLRVVSVNHGLNVYADVADWWTYTDPTDPAAEPEIVYSIPQTVVPVELQYIEVGAGLPTWTPYQVAVNKAVVQFRDNLGSETFENLNEPLRISVAADRTGGKPTEFDLALVPAWYKELYWADEANSPDDQGTVANVLKATITFTGMDSISGRTVTASADVTIEVGDFYDDPSSAGQ